MTQEALKLALEALEEAWYHVGTFQPTEKAIDLYDGARTAIKEALAQPTSSDYALGYSIGFGEGHSAGKALAQPEQDNTYTYASSLATTIWQKHYIKDSPKWKPLDTIDGVLTQIDNMTCGLVREKPAQPEQEPVKMVAYNCTCGRTMKFESVHGVVAPQRTWVGLTNNELQPIADEYRILFGGWVEDFAKAIEAKLKERNG